MRRRWSLLVVAALLAVLLAAPGAFAPSASAQSPAIDQARAAAQQATQDYFDAQAALGTLDTELSLLEAEKEQAQEELAALEEQVADILVEQYIGADGNLPVVEGTDLNRRARAEALARVVTQSDTDALDEYRAAQARLDVATEEIESKLADQEDLVAQLAETQAELERQLAVVEEAERQRLIEEQRRAEEAAREAAAAADRAAAAERAELLARQQAAADAGAAAASSTTSVTTSPPVTTGNTPTTTAPEPEPVPDTPDEPIVEPPPSGGMICPVPGSSFIDSWGAPRPQGWAHQGVDMMASSGTPIVAPVSGMVTHRGNSVGGLAFHIDGSDGRYYYGAHLSSYGQSGQVAAGTVIGYVGNTGDAAATAPHLHLEIHIGGAAVNPYPYVAAVC